MTNCIFQIQNSVYNSFISWQFILLTSGFFFNTEKFHNLLFFNFTDISDDISEEVLEKRVNVSSESPETVVRNILTHLVHLMKDVSAKNNPKCVFDISCAKILVRRPEYKELMAGTEAFRDLDLNLLKSRNEKLCFHGNLQNLMFLHMCLDDIDKATSNTNDLSNKIFCEVCEMEKILRMNLFSYTIGQLGKVRYKSNYLLAFWYL